MDIVKSRLLYQHFFGNTFDFAQEAVKHFGAVQAQDYSGASWGLSLRLKDARKTDIDAAFNDGRILRTHVLRPTWHFVLPEDILWMTKLTTPRIKQLMAYYNRKLELDDKFFAKSHRIITNALAQSKFLTRSEIAEALAQNGIEASGQRLGHIVMQAEIDGLICSGPFRGKQFTYALVAERAPNAKHLSRDESLALLAKRYFTSHGPATLQDFAWWSGLSAIDSKRALEIIKQSFNYEVMGDKTYWFDGASETAKIRPHILLLSVYDEYVIAYKDYSPIFIDKTKSLTNIFGNARLDYVIVKDGFVVGTWRRKIESKKIVIETKLEVDMESLYKELLREATELYGNFFNLPVGLMGR